MKLEWAWLRMPVLRQLYEENHSKKPLQGIKIGMCIHLEAKTALLAATLQDLGAEVSVTSSNPLTTQDDVAAHLTKRIFHVYSWYGETMEEYNQNLQRIADTKPDVILDDGGDLGVLLHEKRMVRNVLGATEETTTGVLRYKAMEMEGALEFPVIAVNNARSKRMFDNKYGSGQSVVDGIFRATNTLIAGKKVVIIGYGWVGKGIASRLRGLGAKVIICEVNPFSALEAHFDGFEVMKAEKAAEIGDIFITATGNLRVISEQHFTKMKDGAILANAGHFDVEVDVKSLRKIAVETRKIRKNIEECVLPNGRRLYLLAEGRLVNIAAGDGHPIEIMDMSFAIQLLSIIYITQRKNLEAKVYNVPEDVDDKVITLELKSVEIEIDRFSEEQEKYLKHWKS